MKHGKQTGADLRQSLVLRDLLEFFAGDQQAKMFCFLKKNCLVFFGPSEDTFSSVLEFCICPLSYIRVFSFVIV